MVFCISKLVSVDAQTPLSHHPVSQNNPLENFHHQTSSTQDQNWAHLSLEVVPLKLAKTLYHDSVLEVEQMQIGTMTS